MSLPGYWMDETSGVLRPAVEAFLTGQSMTLAQIGAMRSYLRQWVDASIWDENPLAGLHGLLWLASMRLSCDELVSREAIARWIAKAVDGGIDPL